VTEGPPITLDVIAAAEILAGVSYTPAERALMMGNLAEQIALARHRRALHLPVDIGPALRFDPRPRGFAMPLGDGFSFTPAATPLPEAEDEIAFAPVRFLAFWIKSGQLSAVRLTQLYLDRIARLNPRLSCFVTVTADAALHRAAELDAMRAAGADLGPLHGIPYAMKDIIDTAGVETAWGAEPYRGRVPAEDAHVTTALHRAGAVLLGKSSVGALAYGELWYGGRTRNPWNPEEGSSGSSAGSAAATAAGLCGFAIGTETLGSIVSPSTRCGVTGLRPSYGRVSRRGAMPLCWSLDKIGPICRSVTDTALVLHVLNEPDGQDEYQIPAPFHYDAERSISGLRLGYFPEDFANAETSAPEREALRIAEGLGLEIEALQRPALPYDSLMGILFAEAAAAFEDLTLSDRDDELTWQDEDAWPNAFRKARFLSAVDHVQLDRLRRLVMRQMDAVFQSVDVIIGPALAGPMLVITNFTGHPSLCLPCGLHGVPTRDPVSLASLHPDHQAPPPGPTFEVPHAICLWGRLYDEGPMLAIGQALERQFGFTGRPPGF
jgi:Asp-tRNA(Asn)/Glu-tRNA(Gln) amidotransferase A subunit family amidase